MSAPHEQRPPHDPNNPRHAILKFMALPDFTPRVGNDPKSVVIHLTTGTGMEIEWKDGHRSVLHVSVFAGCLSVRALRG